MSMPSLTPAQERRLWHALLMMDPQAGALAFDADGRVAYGGYVSLAGLWHIHEVCAQIEADAAPARSILIL